MSIFRKFIIGAAIAMSALSINTAAAQTTPDQFGISYQAPAAQQVFVQPAMGLALKPEEAKRLISDDCFVGPTVTTRQLYKKAAKKGIAPCTKEFYSWVDDEVGKESMLHFVVARMGDGYLSCSLRKITNMGNNRDGCVLYPFNPAFNNAGQVGKYADVDRAEGGDSVKAKVLGAIVAGVANNLTGALANAGAQKIFGTYCGANGGCGARISVAGSTAISGSASTAEGGKANSGSNSSANVVTPTTGCTTNCVPKDGSGK